MRLRDARFHDVDLSGARFRDVAMHGVVVQDSEWSDVVIEGEIASLTINGVDVGPLVEAEPDRRYPDRPAMRPTDPAGFRYAWDVVERLWDQTVERARRLDAGLLHASVDGMPDTPGVPRDRDAKPSLDVVLDLRRDRMATVRRVVDELTDERLAADTEPVKGPGWPKARSYPVRQCLLVVLSEEWHHRLYAVRDLAALEARGS